MNRLLLFSIVLVLFIFYGGKNVPKVMKNNKEILLGIVGGLLSIDRNDIRWSTVIAELDSDEKIFLKRIKKDGKFAEEADVHLISLFYDINIFIEKVKK